MAKGPDQNLLFKLKLATEDFKKKLKGAGGRVKLFGAKAKAVFSRLKKAVFGSIAGIVGVTAAFAKLTMAIGASVKNAIRINAAFAEVNTLFDGPGGLTESTKKAIRAQSDLYGSDMVSNIKGYYDIVSSGITDQTKALEVLNEANKLAKAGLTDIATAADVVTSVMNSYGHETYKVSEITDLLFQTVKKGKTRIPELAASLGQVVPLAAQAGMTFEELSAAIATMTAAGVKTPEVMTQIKGILTSFVRKEGAEAQEVIKKLGHSWDVATFKSKGLADMLNNLLKVTNGNTDEIGKLIPNIRGLSGIMGLASAEGENFNKNLAHMEGASGAADQALKKVSETISDKIKVKTNEAKNAWADLGKQLLGVVVAFQTVSKAIANTINWLVIATKKTGAFLRIIDKAQIVKSGTTEGAARAEEQEEETKKSAEQTKIIEDSLTQQVKKTTRYIS